METAKNLGLDGNTQGAGRANVAAALGLDGNGRRAGPQAGLRAVGGVRGQGAGREKVGSESGDASDTGSAGAPTPANLLTVRTIQGQRRAGSLSLPGAGWSRHLNSSTGRAHARARTHRGHMGLLSQAQPQSQVFKDELAGAAKSGYRVLVPVANPSTLDALVDFAAAVARRKKGEIIALHVVSQREAASPDEARRSAEGRRTLLEETVGSLRDRSVAIHTMTRLSDDPAQAILDTARGEACNLIIMGWQGYMRSVAFGRSLGHVLDPVIAGAPCDVAIVKTKGLDHPRRLMVPTAGGPNAILALDLALAFRLAQPGRGVAGDRGEEGSGGSGPAQPEQDADRREDQAAGAPGGAPGRRRRQDHPQGVPRLRPDHAGRHPGDCLPPGAVRHGAGARGQALPQDGHHGQGLPGPPGHPGAPGPQPVAGAALPGARQVGRRRAQ